MEITENSRLPFTSFDHWRLADRKYRRLPRLEQCPCPSLPTAWHSFWNPEQASLLLESGRHGRYTILVREAFHHLTGDEKGLHVFSTRAEAGTPAFFPGPILPALRNWPHKFPVPALSSPVPPCHGGLFGLISYDLARQLESIPDVARNDLDFPLVRLLDASLIQVYDHQLRSLTTIVWEEIAPQAGEDSLRDLWRRAGERLDQAVRDWFVTPDAPPLPVSSQPVQAPVQTSFSPSSFMQAVETIKEFIAAGDTYQVNLSLRESRPLSVSPETIYEGLRRINPSPYMGLFRLPEWTLVCGSPELLLKRQDDELSTRPIAGTRPRGRLETAEDAALAHELVINPKERAEHLMLVDLLRNDLGRVCTYGSVRVPEFMTVEKYSHVQHIVSLVKGHLEGRFDSWDALAAVFPGGTITGAPKIRTMQIIESLEPVRRGPYTGSLGWIDPRGRNMEWNIIIRSLLAREGWGHVQAGAGIVADSQPESEYRESLQKAKALWQAVAEVSDH